MNPIILFRSDIDTEAELKVAEKYFTVVKQRAAVPTNSFVIGRYSVLPYFKELIEDLRINGSSLIDGFREFQYIANFDYYWDIEEYTFKTWFEGHEIPDDGTKFVVKGRTNSRKAYFKDKMFADTKRDAILLSVNLREDPLIAEQGVIFRKFEKLKTYEILLNDLPVTEEYRFFFYKTKELCHGYYWQNASDEIIKDRKIAPEGIELAHKVAGIISESCNFFVVDVAQKEDGNWVVVECNHGMMSGLSTCDPDELYRNLSEEIK